MLTPRRARLLRRFRPDVVVVGGWNQPAFWQALVAARARVRRRSVGGEQRVAMRAARRMSCAVSRCHARADSSFPAVRRARTCEELGASAERIFVAPNAVDFGVFAERVEAERADRAALRERLGLEGCVFLYVGRLEREKGLDVLVEAMDGVPGRLVLVGSGPLELELRSRARVVGQLGRDELVPWYAAADVLVLPSRSEPWGMTLNEGAAAGLPLVATDAVGAAHDLIEPGVNGFRVPAENVAALREALRTLASDEELRRRAGLRSRELAERFRPETWAAGVVSAARAVAR